MQNNIIVNKLPDTISFVNHASIFIKSNNVRLLSDPWYFGDAFNRGWDLLYENPFEQILDLINETTHIFISHEHPDHFSIPFFKKYCTELKSSNIQIIFQETRDKRVVRFLRSLNLSVIEAKKNKWLKLDDQVHINIFPIGTLDSAFLLETSDYFFINTNDCELSPLNSQNILEQQQKRKPTVLLHQFSYAAWRGSSEWMEKAANYKLKKLFQINKTLKANLLIPFASFIYFSHNENFHLNRNFNDPLKVSNFLKNSEVSHTFLNIYPKNHIVEKLLNDDNYRKDLNNQALNFWNSLYKNIKPKHDTGLDNFSISATIADNYIIRIKESNNLFLMKFINLISLNFIFGSSLIYLKDRHETYLLSYKCLKKIKNNRGDCDIEISSDSFLLIVTQPYGLDTLSVNGRLKEIKKNGFRNFVYSMGFLTLNSSDYGVRFQDILNPDLLRRLISIPIRILLKNN